MKDAAHVDRLWRSARFLPQSVRLLGTRYRALFLAYAQQVQASGELATVADALAFIEFMFRQNRVALLKPEVRALKADESHLRRRFRLSRDGQAVMASEKWRILQWLRL